MAEREALLAEIAQLEADLSFSATDDERQLFDFLRRRALPPEADAPDATETWLAAAANPTAFLPFSKFSANLGELFPLADASVSLSGKTDDDAAPPISHHPLPMTASQELPYLQAFSPLVFRSQIAVQPQGEHVSPEKPLLQKHLITAASASPPDLFLAYVEMTVHTKSLRITEVRVLRMQPAAAAAELQPLAERIIVAVGNQREAGSALVRNVNVLFWAMGEWVRVATRRAKFWCTLSRLVRDRKALREAVQALRSRKKRRPNKRRNFDHADGSDDEDTAHGDEELGGGHSVSEIELQTHLSQTAMDVDIQPYRNDSSRDPAETAIRVKWDITFDWTGEAQSRIGLLIGVPGKWRKADNRDRLDELPNLFDQLVHGNEDPETAVKTVVALLVGEDTDSP